MLSDPTLSDSDLTPGLPGQCCSGCPSQVKQVDFHIASGSFDSASCLLQKTRLTECFLLSIMHPYVLWQKTASSKMCELRRR